MTPVKLTLLSKHFRDRMRVKKYKECAEEYFHIHTYTNIGMMYVREFIVTAELLRLPPYQLGYLYKAYWNPLHGHDQEISDFITYTNNRFNHELEWDNAKPRSSTPRMYKRLIIGFLLWKDHRYYVEKDRRTYGDI